MHLLGALGAAPSAMRRLILLAALLAAARAYKNFDEEVAGDEWDKLINRADKNNDEKLDKDELDDIAGEYVYDGPGVRKSLRDGQMETLKTHKADVEQADRNRNGLTSRAEWIHFRSPEKGFEKVHPQKDENPELQPDQHHALEESVHRKLHDDDHHEYAEKRRKALHEEL